MSLECATSLLFDLVPDYDPWYLAFSLPPVKLHCSMLAEDAIRSAIKDYKSKRSKASTTASASSGSAQVGASA